MKNVSHTAKRLPHLSLQLVCLHREEPCWQRRTGAAARNLCLWRALEVPHFLEFGEYCNIRKMRTESARVAGLNVFSSTFQLLQMLFFGLAAVSDLQPHPESALNRCKDFLFSVFAFPVGMVRTTVNHNSSVKTCCSIIVSPLSVCRSTLLDYFCLWQRAGVPGHHWRLLPSVDKSRYGTVNMFTSTVHWATDYPAMQHPALMNEQIISFLSIRLSFLCCLEKYWCSLTCIHGPDTLWWRSPLWVCVIYSGKNWVSNQMAKLSIFDSLFEAQSYSLSNDKVAFSPGCRGFFLIQTDWILSR